MADQPLSALFDEREVDAFARRVAERASDRLLALVMGFTPVGGPSLPGGGPRRAPGTLQRSWRSAPVRVQGASFIVEVSSDDVAAAPMEFGTRPHVIRPSPSRGPASVLESGKPRQPGTSPRARLRFIAGGRVVYARTVHHPGTRPYRMMGKALAALAQEIPEIAREVERERG